MFLIDTNVWLELLLGQEKADKGAKLASYESMIHKMPLEKAEEEKCSGKTWLRFRLRQSWLFS